MSEPTNLKNTLNLPRTGFPMKANLTQLEPRMLQYWKEIDLYRKLRQVHQQDPTYVLHDGPPYANGHIHLGTALNKILKDLVVKSKSMAGFNAPYLPGWDCHGLPIEIRVVGRKREDLDPLQARRQCREYAQRFVDIQREEFQRLGVFGEWENPYLTMSFHYEAETARLLGRFVEQGAVYKGFKPVYWCIFCETALAEAEVEYRDHESPSVYVKFPLVEGAPLQAREWGKESVFGLIWTTTPWTLPANLALCFHPDFEYSFVQTDSEIYLLARDLTETVARQCGWDQYRVLLTLPGRELTGLRFRHPWLQRDSKTVLGEHVTLDQGTGIVHTAPGHGEEDFELGRQYGLEIYCPVDEKGRFWPEVEHFGGMQVFEANPAITTFMDRQGVLVNSQEISHSYPHCWRCHNPVIFRATPQWFISMEHNRFRERALEAIRKVRWSPAWGEERIANMVAGRPDWCISRQRIWGVPIPALECKKCHRSLLTPEIIARVADFFEREGADAWYARPLEALIPSGTRCPCGGGEFDKEFDILDVWFDSGVSHAIVLSRDDLPWPADLYLEGGDQYRGWFQSSLLVGVGVCGGAPYRQVVCHGWTLDEKGRAMSKSLGNVISPMDVIRENGAEILRLWVASINYSEDARWGEETVSRLRDAYRKIRNTNRFLLGNLYDFQPAHCLPRQELPPLDRWALARTAAVAAQVEKAYGDFEFHQVFQALHNFCVVDLSSFYLDIVKDRLYVSAPDSPERRAAQTTLFFIADALVRLLAPILPFTAEEIWQNLYPRERPAESVHLAGFSKEIHAFADSALLRDWESLFQIREKVMKALEEERQGKRIGHSLEAALTLRGSARTLDSLKVFGEDPRFLFIVSDAKLIPQEDPPGELQIEVSRARGAKCERCWHYRPSVGSSAEYPTLCNRCLEVVRHLGVRP